MIYNKNYNFNNKNTEQLLNKVLKNTKDDKNNIIIYILNELEIKLDAANDLISKLAESKVSIGKKKLTK